MHSSRCIPIEGSVETVMVPRPGSQHAVNAGVNEPVASPVKRNFALMVDVLPSTVVGTLDQGGRIRLVSGDGEVLLTLKPGRNRILLGNDVDSMFITSPYGAVWWNEDLSNQSTKDP